MIDGVDKMNKLSKIIFVQQNVNLFWCYQLNCNFFSKIMVAKLSLWVHIDTIQDTKLRMTSLSIAKFKKLKLHIWGEIENSPILLSQKFDSAL